MHCISLLNCNYFCFRICLLFNYVCMYFLFLRSYHYLVNKDVYNCAIQLEDLSKH